MILPTHANQWLQEVRGAYETAQEATLNGPYELLDIYKLAPAIAAKNRNIEDSELVDSLIEMAIEAAQADAALDAESRSRYKFHFVFSYLFAHVNAEWIDEMEADRIMEFLNDNLNLFNNDTTAI